MTPRIKYKTEQEAIKHLQEHKFILSDANKWEKGIRYLSLVRYDLGQCKTGEWLLIRV